MGIAAMSVMKPDLIMKSIIPVVMAGIIAIYGFAVSVLVVNERKTILSDSIICDLQCRGDHIRFMFAFHFKALKASYVYRVCVKLQDSIKWLQCM